MLTKRIQYFGGEDTLGKVIEKVEVVGKRYQISVELKFYSPIEKGKIKGTGISEIVGMREEFVR